MLGEDREGWYLTKYINDAYHCEGVFEIDSRHLRWECQQLYRTGRSWSQNFADVDHLRPAYGASKSGH